MPTGTCGINCDTCGLNSRGVCSSCGSGTSEQARLKIDAQKQLLGAPCPILACARLNRLDYCMKDCRQFPCENFSADGINGYPFSKGYLDMQNRRRTQFEQSDRSNDQLIIADQHWQQIRERGLDTICRCSGAHVSNGNSLLIDVMNINVRIDTDLEKVKVEHHAEWLPADPLLAFVTIVYLAQSQSLPITGNWVTEKDLSCSEFFRGIHQLRTESVLNRFGNAPQDLINAAAVLGGVETSDYGDAAVRFWVFPAIPIKLILWCSDDELDAALTVMFDQSIDSLLAGDGVWALVEMVCNTLVACVPGTVNSGRQRD